VSFVTIECAQTKEEELTLRIPEIKGYISASQLTGRNYPVVEFPLEIHNFKNRTITLCGIEYVLFLNDEYFGGCIVSIEENTLISIAIFEDSVEGKKDIQRIKKESQVEEAVYDPEFSICGCGCDIPAFTIATLRNEVGSENLTAEALIKSALSGKRVKVNWRIYALIYFKISKETIRFSYNTELTGISSYY